MAAWLVCGAVEQGTGPSSRYLDGPGSQIWNKKAWKASSQSAAKLTEYLENAVLIRTAALQVCHHPPLPPTIDLLPLIVNPLLNPTFRRKSRPSSARVLQRASCLSPQHLYPPSKLDRRSLTQRPSHQSIKAPLHSSALCSRTCSPAAETVYGLRLVIIPVLFFSNFRLFHLLLFSRGWNLFSLRLRGHQPSPAPDFLFFSPWMAPVFGWNLRSPAARGRGGERVSNCLPLAGS